MKLPRERRTRVRWRGLVLPGSVFAIVFVGAIFDWRQPLDEANFLYELLKPEPVLQQPPSDTFACEVAYVNDGDTLRCRDGTRVRIHAIAVRETDNSCSLGHPCPTASAAESKAALTRLAGSRITCVQIGTSFERVTAICRNASGVEINCAMVASGAAAVWDRFNRQSPICRT